MLRKSKLWRVAAISLSCSVFNLAPALGGDCGSHDYDALDTSFSNPVP